MAKTHKSASLNERPDDDANEYGFYYYADLLRLGIVKNRADLYRKIHNEDFPRPEKSSDAMQAAAPYRRFKVHAYLDRRAARCEGVELDVEDAEAPPKKRRGRPRKVAAATPEETVD